jgi:DNA processing protein
MYEIKTYKNDIVNIILQKKQLLDVIALDCDLPVFKTASILLNMELKGVVRPLPGKLFEVV